MACLPGYDATMVMRDGNERAGAGRRKGAAPGVSEPRMELAAAPVADGIVAGRPRSANEDGQVSDLVVALDVGKTNLRAEVRERGRCRLRVGAGVRGWMGVHPCAR